MTKKINLALIFLFAAATTFAQRAGSLDTTFNHTGIVYNSIGGDSINEGLAMALQSDGKIVVVGYTSKDNDGTEKCIVTRYDSDGTLDTSFNKTGYSILAIDSPIGSQLNSVVILSNGKILALGAGGIFSYVFLTRYNANGELDSTFGINGIAISSVSGEASSLALQSNGKIIMGGSDNFNFLIARFDSTGGLDSTFNDSGTVILDFGSNVGLGNYFGALAVQDDDKIVAVGGYSPKNHVLLVLVRLNSDGSFDSTFGTNGIDTNNYNTYAEGIANSVAIQPDGKIVTAGTISQMPYLQYDTVAVVRYNTNGTFDTTFANKGIAQTLISGVAYSLLLQPDGKIVAAGREFYNDFYLLRLNSNGTPDTSFGSDGNVFTPIMPNSIGEAYSVAMQSDGKIVAAGFSENDSTPYNSYFALARYNNPIPAGILNLSSTPTSLLIYPNPVHDIETLDYILTGDEILSMNLYDITGRMVKNFMNNEKVLAGEYKQQLNFENLAAGTYILTISNEDSKTESLKIIKQ